MKRAPDNILQWSDLEAYPAFNQRKPPSRFWYVFGILCVLALAVGVLAALGVGQ